MEFKLFSEVPAHVGPEWHKDREVADHINEPGHRERLMETADLIDGLAERIAGKTVEVADWGAGNGGLLNEITARFAARGESLKAWGYDLMPLNIGYAKSVYDVDVRMEDIVTGNPHAGDIVVLTEILEHLVKPHCLLDRLAQEAPLEYVIASSPAFEAPDKHYEFHLWAWTGESYRIMFERCGYTILGHWVTAFNGTQFVVATPGR